MPEVSWFTASRWAALWRSIGAEGPAEAVFRTILLPSYAEPHRYYHTAQHIDECLEAFSTIDEGDLGSCDVSSIEMALWFHDTVCLPGSGDNEERSAVLAQRVLEQAHLPAAFVSAVARLIRASDHREAPTDLEAGIVTGVDLAILGQPEDRYLEYEQQIREEYSYLPDTAFTAGRTSVLQRFLDRPHIYNTTGFRARYESAARRNLAATLKRLEERS